MSGLFGMGEAKDMFVHLQKKWGNFYENPTEEGLIDTLFPMYHLREWIYQGKIADHRTKNNAELTLEEKIDKHLLALAEYQIVRSLCNHSKHYKTGPSNKEHETVEIKGPRAGLMRCGDSLGMSHFIVDGRDIRDIFVVVYRAYYEYFESLRSNS